MRESTQNQIRLFVLVILAFLPAVGLYVYANSILEEQEFRQSEQELVQFGHVASLEYNRLIAESEQLLGALAEFPEIRSGDPGTCGRRLARVLDHTPQYTTITLIGTDGYLACGALTLDGGLYLGDRAYFAQASATGRFAVGDYAVGRITGRPTLGVAYPILSGGEDRQVEAVLAAAIDLSDLAASAVRMGIPERASFTLMDRDGTILIREPAGRNPMGYDTVGAQAPEAFMALAAGVTGPTVIHGTDLDGLLRVFAVTPLRGVGLSPEGYLLVGQEEGLMAERAGAVVSQELRFLVSAGLVLMVLAWLFGHYALIRTSDEGWTTSEAGAADGG